MANFQEHIDQANHNLAFLEQANLHASGYWDWQVTVAFYVAVHLINAHIATRSGMSYRSHEQTDGAINPFNHLSITKLPESEYLAYSKLQGLARRARYLCNEDHSNKATNAHLTYDKHFARAMRNLDQLIDFMQREYKVNLRPITISCPELKVASLKLVKVK